MVGGPMRAISSLSLIIVLTMVLSAAAPGIGVVSSATPNPSGSFAPDVFALTSVNSSNWAGYAAENTSGETNNSVTMSAGTWVQPAVNCTAGKRTDVSTWVGMDGYSTKTVEQTGTSGDCNHGVASYNAWYEFYPAASKTIGSIKVHPGDTLSAWVNYSFSPARFTLTIRDGSHSFKKIGGALSGQRTSAECIVERDSVRGTVNDLSKFKTDHFTACTATINGVAGGIGTFPQVFEINMKNSGKVIAHTSALTSGSSFYDTWKGYG
jgi:hypothetical protein